MGEQVTIYLAISIFYPLRAKAAIQNPIEKLWSAVALQSANC